MAPLVHRFPAFGSAAPDVSCPECGAACMDELGRDIRCLCSDDPADDAHADAVADEIEGRD